MPELRVAVDVGHPSEDRFETVEALVALWSPFSWLPKDLLKRLGISSEGYRWVRVAFGPALHRVLEGRRRRYSARWIRVRLGERVQPTIVFFGAEGTRPVLGDFTLQGFGLAPDLEHQRLIPYTPTMIVP